MLETKSSIGFSSLNGKNQHELYTHFISVNEFALDAITSHKTIASYITIDYFVISMVSRDELVHKAISMIF